MDDIIWKQIKEFPAYEISNKGNIRRNNRILKHNILKINNRPLVKLRKNNKTIGKYVHRLMIETFLNISLNDKQHVSFKDNNPTNLNIDNLIIEPKKICHLTRSKKLKIKSKNNKITEYNSKKEFIEKTGFSEITYIVTKLSNNKLTLPYLVTYGKMKGITVLEYGY